MQYAKAVTIGLTLCAVVLCVGFIASGGRKSEIRAKKCAPDVKVDLLKFGFNDIFSSKFGYSSVSPRWISGTQYIYMDADSNVKLKDAAMLTEMTLMPGKFYIDNKARSYKVSADQKFVLLLTNYVKGWRHSYNGTYVMFDVTNQNMRNDVTLPDDIQYITWSPVDNAMAYVVGFDIYYRETPTSTDVRVTTTGRANFVYNGIPDWVYEEEMISSNNVMYFSPDGTQLAYAQFDDTGCDHIQFSRYDGQQYPKMLDVSYPKAGTTQPTNKVFIFDTKTNVSVEVQPTTELMAGDYLFSRVTWANGTRAAITWCDRLQTWTVMMVCDLVGNDYSCEKKFEHKTTNGWLYQRRPYWIPVFGQTSDEFFMVLPNADWQHLARVESGTNNFITSGEYTVTSYSASYPAVELYHADTDYVYFLSTLDGEANRQIYRKKARDVAAADPPQCITCQLKSSYPNRCNYISPSFSTDGSYIVVGCRGEGPPLYAQYEVDHTAVDENEVLKSETILQGNEDLVTAVSGTQMSKKSYGIIKSGTGYDFHFERWDPPNFDETKKYPLLIDVYAGPGYQNVVSSWTRSWAPAYVPVGLEAIVVRIDGRGSNFYGDKFMHEVYKSLGQKEIDDQIEAARYFAALPYVDETRIAIWGWSYGGFATSHALGLGTDVLKCGIAVAPLVNWKYYDTIYAERYMGLPQENVDGYEKASVVNKAKDFPQSSYYLIHGMADDNVHFQNAAQLSKALVEADINFNDFFYADQDHSINQGPNTSRHVYQLLTKLLCQCYGINVPSDVWA